MSNSFQFLKEITNATCEKTIEQPTLQTIKDQVLLAPGPVVSYQSFKHGKRSAKAIAEAEYSRVTESLKEDGFGRIVEFTIPRARGKCKVFIKSKPDPWPKPPPSATQNFKTPFQGQFIVEYPHQCGLFCKAMLTLHKDFCCVQNRHSLNCVNHAC